MRPTAATRRPPRRLARMARCRIHVCLARAMTTWGATTSRRTALPAPRLRTRTPWRRACLCARVVKGSDAIHSVTLWASTQDRRVHWARRSRGSEIRPLQGPIPNGSHGHYICHVQAIHAMGPARPRAPHSQSHRRSESYQAEMAAVSHHMAPIWSSTVIHDGLVWPHGRETQLHALRAVSVPCASRQQVLWLFGHMYNCYTPRLQSAEPQDAPIQVRRGATA